MSGVMMEVITLALFEIWRREEEASQDHDNVVCLY